MPLVTTKQTLHGEVGGDSVYLVYTRFTRTSATGGQIENDLLPADTLTLRIGGEDFSFEGGGIEVTPTPVGVLATVQIAVVPDLGTTSVSFLTPAITAPEPSAENDIRTVAVRALAKTSIAGPEPHTQAVVYTSFHLHGAQVVQSSAPVSAG